MDLKSKYHDPAFHGSFSGQRRFHEHLKKSGVRISLQKTKDYLKSNDAYTLHKPVNKPKKFRRVYTKHIGYLYQIDLVDMHALESKGNQGYKWIINCIDTFSKKLWSFKTKDKKGKTITDTLEPLLTTNRPNKIETDGGKEFYNSHFKKLLRRLNIQLYSISSDRKCSIVERVNRTLKTRMYRSFTARGSHVWYNILDSLVEGYNNSHHRSIKRTPNEVNLGNQDEVRDTLYPTLPPRKPPKLKVNDLVRITRMKSAFQKGYEQNWSFEVFKICTIKDTTPVTYSLKDWNSELLDGSFYEKELQICDKSAGIYPIEKIVRRRTLHGVRQYLVKFAGYPNSFNEWINQSDLFDL